MKLPSVKRYPKTLTIGGEEWQIKFVNKMPNGWKGSMGLCDSQERVIRIRRNMDNLETFRTFIHEVLHACDMEHKVRLSHKTVYALEAAIAELLLVNF